MRPDSRQYLLWALLPPLACAFLGHGLAERERRSLSAVSTARIGALASHLFTEEMGARAVELTLKAPVLTDTALDSPLLQTAGRGDTVAALGSSSGILTLSVALAEEEEGALRLRATTAPFPARTPRFIASRTGYSLGLYLRGRRVLSTSPEFGPGELGEPGAPGSIPDESILIPLASPGASGAPAQLLVGSPKRDERNASFPLWIPILLVGMGLAILAPLVTPPEAPAVSSIPPHLTVLTLLPLTLLWALLLAIGAGIEEEAEDLLRRDMVRVLAVMRDSEIPLSPRSLASLTGLRVIRGEGGRLLESSVQDTALVGRILALPLPPPTFPVLDRIQAGREEFTYARLREGPGGTLSLVASSAASGLGRFRLILSALGGVASLAGLGHLFRLRSRPRA